jgi:UDP-sugar diphosphatase
MIENIQITKLDENKYIQPVKISFTQNSNERTWEAVKSFDSVAALLYHTGKDAFLLVKQFRAPVMLNGADVKNAYIYELCAGICDKDKSLEETMAEEIDEECGYSVKPANIEKITAFYTCVGISGAYQSLFYAEIDDSMQIHNGGGDSTEEIELIWMPIDEAKNFILNMDIPKTPGVGLAFYWWFDNKYKKL